MQPINDASKQSVRGFMADLLDMADASVEGEHDPEGMAVAKLGLRENAGD